MSDKETHIPDPKAPRGRKITRKPKENIIESYLIKRVKDLGGICWKFNSASVAGVPDRMIILNGVVSFLEVKRPGLKPKSHQRVAIAVLRRHGILADFADTKEKVDAFLVSIMERNTLNEPIPPNNVTLPADLDLPPMSSETP